MKDTVYKSDGSLASGTVVITWQSFVTGDSKPVFGGTKTSTLSNGALTVALAPNSGATPAGTSYRVRYYQSGGLFSEEFWVVPASAPVAAPAAPTSVTQTGTLGSTTYYYWLSATNANGETLLGPSRVTTTSNATLSGSNYNVISWAAVSGATGYRLWRTTTASAPTAGATGSYLVGATASTTINDQSNTLSSATVPEVNTTDPRRLSDVRVMAAPSTSVMLSAAQVTGTSIVSNPTSTQTITAPGGSGIPLQLTGRNNNNSNVFEIYDNQATPQLAGSFTSGGLFHLGASSGFSSSLQIYYNNFQNSVAAVNPGGVGRTLGVLSQDNNVSHNPTAFWSVQESTNTSGTRASATAIEGAAYHTTAGNLTDLEGVYAYVENSSGSATVTKAAAAATQAMHSGAGTTQNLVGLQINSNSKSAGTVTTNFGISVADQNISGATNYAIYSGAGLVEHRDAVRLGNSGAQMQFSAAGNTLSATNTTSGSNAGSFTVQSQNVVSGSGNGGDLNLYAGNGSGAATNGNVLLKAGETASPSSATTGGDVKLRTGLPSNSNATGNIVLQGYTNAATPTLTDWVTVTGATGAATFATSVTSPQFKSTASDPADAGVLRLGNDEAIAAEASPAGTDGTLKYNSSEQWEMNSPLTVTGSVTASKALLSHQEAVTFSQTPTFDASLGNSFKMTLTNNVTSSSISNATTGQFITLLLCQDSTGSRTMTWPTDLKLAGGSFTLTTTLNKCDSVTAVYDGTNWYETARAANL